jgi:hypothetical protein
LAVLRLYLLRARDHDGGLEIAWFTDYWRGECPSRGWWWRELKEANKPPCRPKYTKKQHQKLAVTTLFGLKIAEYTVFRSKVLNKIYSQDAFLGIH